MQQTEKYKFNLIEMDDTFSPEPLNENMEKAEKQLAQLADANAARQAETAALDKRVTQTETHKLAIGSYVGTQEPQLLNLGFKPLFAIIGGRYLYRGRDLYVGEQLNCRIVENGIRIEGGMINLNLTTRAYDYFAIA